MAIAGRYKRFRNLSCREELDVRLKSDNTISSTTKWLQEEKQECTDISPASLRTMLTNYKNNYLLKQEIAQESYNKRYGRYSLKRNVSKELDELEELEKLYDLHVNRIEDGRKSEIEVGMINKQVSKDIGLAVNILKKHHDIKMDLGIDGGRNLGTMGVRQEFTEIIRKSHGKEVADAFSNPGSRSKVLGAARALLSQGVDDLDVEDAEFELVDEPTDEKGSSEDLSEKSSDINDK